MTTRRGRRLLGSQIAGWGNTRWATRERGRRHVGIDLPPRSHTALEHVGQQLGLPIDPARKDSAAAGPAYASGEEPF